MPVDPEYTEIIRGLAESGVEFRVHYFDAHSRVLEVRGSFAGLIRNDSGEEFVVLEGNGEVRIDRIIAVNGRPGPAYDEYDSYALACLDCMGGMD